MEADSQKHSTTQSRIRATDKTLYTEPNLVRGTTTITAFATANATTAATASASSPATSLPPQYQTFIAKLGLFFLVIMFVSFIHCHYYHYDMVLVAWYRLTPVITYAYNIFMLFLLLAALAYCVSQINSDFDTIYVCSIPIVIYLIFLMIWKLEEHV